MIQFALAIHGLKAKREEDGTELNDDIEHLECMVEVFDDKKMSQEVLISECLVGIDLLNLYTSRVPLTGPEPIRFFRKEYMVRLRILTDTLNTLIRRVRIK